MLKRQLGASDIQASLIGYGCWKAGKSGWPGAEDESTLSAISAALELGVNYFDTAPVYGLGHSEELLGKALKGVRDRVIIATKVGMVWDAQGKISKHLEPSSVLAEIDASLKRLGTDYIDLIQVHWNDHETPIESVMEAFSKARDQDKVRYFGVCNLDVNTLERARQEVADLVAVQVLYNLIDRNADRYLDEPLEYRTEGEIVPYCKQHGLSLIPYSPLGQGFLSDHFDWQNLPKNDIRRHNTMFAENVNRRKELVQLAHDHGMTLAQLAIAWLARQEVVTSIIVSSTEPKHIADNIKALDRLGDVPTIS